MLKTRDTGTVSADWPEVFPVAGAPRRSMARGRGITTVALAEADGIIAKEILSHLGPRLERVQVNEV